MERRKNPEIEFPSLLAKSRSHETAVFFWASRSAKSSAGSLSINNSRNRKRRKSRTGPVAKKKQQKKKLARSSQRARARARALVLAVGVGQIGFVFYRWVSRGIQEEMGLIWILGISRSSYKSYLKSSRILFLFSCRV